VELNFKFVIVVVLATITEIYEDIPYNVDQLILPLFLNFVEFWSLLICEFKHQQCNKWKKKNQEKVTVIFLWKSNPNKTHRKKKKILQLSIL
jgi:hypothetical protein